MTTRSAHQGPTRERARARAASPIAGGVPTGGSAYTHDEDDIAVQEARPADREGTDPMPTRWLATFKRMEGSSEARVHVSVVCATMS